MEAVKAMADNAHARYQREKTRVIPIRFFLSTDKDILDRLEQQDNKSGYIKRLIRKDIAKSKEDAENDT